MEFIRVHTQKILIVKCSNFGLFARKILQRWTIKIILGISAYVRRIHSCLYEILARMRWRFKIIIRNIYVRTQNTSMCICTCANNPALEDKYEYLLGMSAYVRRIHPCVYEVLGHMRK